MATTNSAAIESAKTDFPTVDLSTFEGDDPVASKEVAEQFVQICHRYGYAAIRGHGLSEKTMEEAFQCSSRFFALPLEDKMKAPHPPTPLPHRGYSAIGQESLYTEEERLAGNVDAIRKVKDFKESYEIGSEEDPFQQNIWIPDNVQPDFKPFMLRLYSALDELSARLLRAIATGLDMAPADGERLLSLNSRNENQLRLLHYPPISRKQLHRGEVASRLPAHTDWGTFTVLFQDRNGGLEFRDPKTGTFSTVRSASHDAVLFNIGLVLQNFTNNYFIGAEHRVSVPTTDELGPEQQEVAARYSIPYFIAPPHDMVISPGQSFTTEKNPAKYEPVRFDKMYEQVSKYQYVKG